MTRRRCSGERDLLPAPRRYEHGHHRLRRWYRRGRDDHPGRGRRRAAADGDDRGRRGSPRSRCSGHWSMQESVQLRHARSSRRRRCTDPCLAADLEYDPRTMVVYTTAMIDGDEGRDTDHGRRASASRVLEFTRGRTRSGCWSSVGGLQDLSPARASPATSPTPAARRCERRRDDSSVTAWPRQDALEREEVRPRVLEPRQQPFAIAVEEAREQLRRACGAGSR